VATVDRRNGMRAALYSNDHTPPNVHVLGRGREAVFEFDCQNGTVILRDNFSGFRISEIRQFEEWLLEILDRLCAKWREIHGDN
jgi:Domain of unknown function (DUF4160)